MTTGDAALVLVLIVVAALVLVAALHHGIGGRH
jgi:hypothetical protein